MTAEWRSHGLGCKSNFDRAEVMANGKQKMFERNRPRLPKAMEVVRRGTNASERRASALLTHCALGFNGEVESHEKRRNVFRLSSYIDFETLRYVQIAVAIDDDAQVL